MEGMVRSEQDTGPSEGMCGQSAVREKRAGVRVGGQDGLCWTTPKLVWVAGVDEGKVQNLEAAGRADTAAGYHSPLSSEAHQGPARL